MGRIRSMLVCGAGLSSLVLATTANAQQRSFDIPSEPAVRSIPEFARQAGLQIVAPASQLAGVETPAIKGQKDARTALRDLLAGTGLVIASDQDGIIALKRAPPALKSEVAGESVDPAAVSEVVVTGSHIAGAPVDATAPVSIVSANTLTGLSGGVSIGDQLSLLPQFRATFTQAASTGIGVYNGVGQVGLNLLDLRGLGPSRTLVLQNGERLVSSTQQLSQPDTNTIPVELLDRVEILTGGASSVYGADAIAGVVNFVLKDHYDGEAVTAQGGLSDHGDAGNQRYSFVAGRNFDGGKGNIAGSIDYDSQEGLRYYNRRFSNGQDYFAPNPLAGQAGQSQEFLLTNLHVLAESAGGTLPYGPPYYRFSSDGTLHPTTLGSVTLASGISNGGNGLQTLRDTSLMPTNQHYSFNVLGHYDFNSHLTVFGQIDLFNENATAYSEPNVTAQYILKTNPYLTTQALSVLNSYGPTANASGFYLYREMPELGDTGERDNRLTLHSIVGVKGELWDDWKYQLTYSYGRTDTTTTFLGEYYPGRLSLATNAVRDTSGVLGTPGAIVCAARLAPHAPNATVDSCVPVDLLGDGTISQAARNYLTVNTQASGVLQQNDVNGYVSGDTRSLFKLPAGPISVVAGIEYRDESTSYTPDPRDLAGLTSNLGTQTVAGSVKVFEAYSEAKAPILADLPWAKKLELTGSVRIADYSLGGVGTKTSWGLGLNYEPVSDLHLRTSYERAVRAPNVAELYQANIGTYFYISDPCDAANINLGTKYRAANCAALGVPAGYKAPPYGTPTVATSGGNPNLNVEQGETFTIGATYTPNIIPRSSFSIDYYHVVLNNAIVSPNPEVIIDQCVDSSSINNVFCAATPRNSTTHNIASIAQQPLNLNKLLVSGIDFDAHYDFAVPLKSRVFVRLLANYVIDSNDYDSPTQPDFPTQIAQSINNPRWTVTLSTQLTHGPFSATYNLRYFSSMYRADPSNFISVGGQPALDPNLLPANLKQTGDTFDSDVRFAWKVRTGVQLYAGVDNLFDVIPPPGIYGAGFGGAIYDNIGRFIYAGTKVDF